MKGILMLLLIMLSNQGFTQGLLKRLKNTAQQTAENAADNKTAETVNTGMEKVFSPKKKKKESGKKSENKVAADTSITPGSKKDLSAYAKYDFVPGEELVYANDFTEDEDGELAMGWNSSGSGAVVKLQGLPGKWLHLHQSSSFLSDNKQLFSQNFTVEFDLVFRDFGNGIINYPALGFGILASGGRSSTDNRLLQTPDEQFLLKVNAGVINDGNGNSTFALTSSERGNSYFAGGQKPFPKIEAMIAKPVHVAIQVQKTRFRMWVNNEKAYDLPNALSDKYQFNQLFFEVSDNGYSNDQVGIFLGNIRVAKGIPDTRHKLISEGRFSTTGILFDVNKATIRPESYPVLKEIATILNANKDIRVKIIGHTDSDGDDAANQQLSEARAKSVREFLVREFEVAQNRMETEGKGEKEPVADNGSKEGKAKNRRVEFVKL